MADEIVIAVRAEDNFSGVLGNFGNIMTGIKSTLDIVGQAFQGVYNFGADFVQSAMDSQNAVADLEATLKSTGNAVGLTSQQLQDMASELQNVTKFSDETITSGEAMLLTFTNIGGDIFPQATEAMLNLAEKFGSVDSAAVQLGKALNDPISGITALSRVGVSFSEEQKATIKTMMDMGDVAGAQGVILAELEKEFGGLAEAAGQTFAGQLEIAKNQVDNIKESIGNALLPILSNLLGKFLEFVNQPAIMNFFNSLATTFQNFPNDAIGATSDILYSLGYALEQIGVSGANDFLSNLGDILSSGDIFGGLTTSIGDFLSNIDWASVGDSIATGINNIDWVVVGAAIKQGLILASQGLDFVIKNVIVKAINDINWGNVASALGNAITGLLAGVFGYVNWDALMVDFRNGFVYIGQQALNGLASIFGYSAWSNLANDFMNGLNYLIAQIKSFLGISSPSTVFMNIGRDIIQGLINGWNNLFSTFQNLISSGISTILDLFAPFLALFGIDVGNTTSGNAGSGSGTGAGSGTGSGAQTVNNYFYGPVYIGAEGDLNNGNYDCPSPNPIVANSANQLVTSGF